MRTAPRAGDSDYEAVSSVGTANDNASNTTRGNDNEEEEGVPREWLPHAWVQ